ncbi:peptidylprolyl isomerase [Campylobacter hyointestinalis subsp. hyointestinalis]|uniref:FKBP-type peptidyl-prolyl cis-trans isomerase n=1 Tax=Campylobacter hyointestinalis TaxID=198 RepID=UPI0007252036|nr:FKBP-type peptidyl-prolyl cis-trans isomerase [Campylobacter hyointestinalis]PPB58256.1 peptidylprolyl isomerase [Campylobacter hyointestinalis subsp. hyointestinalis]QCU00534.1 peptidylprolyl isomerase [Campylobacter hyointestinalis subsp. hyointestinalis]CUU79157.1 fkbp-type peptidyl-prolyl cis-trans isomerase slyd [Campylobacter hyointestinalis subsp. hyointestinalis]
MSKVIKMFYELKDAKTGELLESNIDGQEIAFVSGKNQVLESLEAGVINLKSGESTIISIPAAQGVGEYDEAALQVLPKEQFAGIELNEGMELFGEGEDGSSVRVIVKAIGENEVTVDFNHPYAGKDLEFNVKVTENRDADADEELTGVVAMPHVCGCGGHGHHHEHGGEGCCGGHGHNEDHEDGECCGGHGHDKDGGGCCGKQNH